MAKLIINEENKKSRIEPEIYGHFSEHLGRCIMREFTSAKIGDSECKRHAHRCCGRIKGIKSSGTALAGWLLCGRISLDGRNRTRRKSVKK